MPRSSVASKFLIRYRVRPEAVQVNLALLRAFFEELEADCPPGLVYEAFLLEDRQSFVHLVDTVEGALPFSHLSSYRRYRDTVDARCANPPEMVRMELVGKFSGLR